MGSSGTDEVYTGWANSISQESKSNKRQKYDKKSRKFYTEEEAMGEKEDSGKDDLDEDIIEDVKKMEEKLKRDGLKAAGSANYKSRKGGKRDKDVDKNDDKDDRDKSGDKSENNIEK